jgi:putative ABC transport system permease protein
MNNVTTLVNALFSPFSKLIENVRIAFSSLTANKLRAFLTVIGIGVGIAAVIILVTLGDSVRDYVSQQFLSTGADLVTVRAGGGFGFATVQRGVSRSSITDKDYELLADPVSLTNVKTVLPVLSLNRVVEYGTGEEMTSVLATYPTYFDTLSRTIGSGRLFDDNDLDTAARVAVIGQTTVSNLFPTETDPVGQTIRVGGIDFRVIGVLASAGNSAGGFGNQDNLVAIPLTTARVYLDTTSTVGGAKPLSQIYLKVTNSTADTINSVVAAATDLLKAAHKIKANA